MLITLQQIRDHHPCSEGWRKLLTSLGNPSNMTMKVSIGDIAKSNGAQDAIWCTRCLPESERINIIRAILPSVKRAVTYTTDKRVHDCINAIERWCAGDKSINLSAAAEVAYAVAYAVGEVAEVAAYAVGAVAEAVAAAVAAAAAEAVAAAAYAVGAAAEKEKQVADIIAIFPLDAFKT